ncbi:MAG: S9 family peptidase [Gemmatimonadetes bacterium]|nr:S9 family peptidase [Gemmatimonadota bacterium]
MIHNLRFLPAGLAFLLVLGMGIAEPAAAQDQRPLTALDLYHLRTAGNVAVSPDGRRVAYVVTEVDSAANRYKRDLWIAAADNSGTPRRLTWTGSSALGAPVFSPDGRRIAFTAAREGGRSQIWILPLAEGGEAWPLTDLRTGAGNPVFSRDGRRIAFTSSLTPEELARDTAAPDTARARVDAGAIRSIHQNRDAALAAIRAKLANNARSNDPRVVTRLDYLGETSIQDERYSQIYVTDVQPAAGARRLTRGTFSSGSPAWSPDGRSLVYSASPPLGDYHPDYERASDVYVIAVDGGEPRRLAEAGYTASGPQFSRDGRYIVYTRTFRGEGEFSKAVNNELVVMRADGSDRRSVSGSLDRGVGSYTVTPDGWLYFTTPSEGATPLHRTRLDRIAPRRIVDGPRGILSFDVGGGTVAWAQMQPANPSDIYAARADGSRERRLTALNDSLLAAVHVGEYEEFWYPSFDGRRVHGWIIRPLGVEPGTRAPLAVQIHGGPHAMWGPGEASMWLEYQMLAGAGYTVFFSNPRGSGGYGEEGLQSIFRDWGTSPGRDILIGADSVIARGLADPERQVVTGGSYAGFMTAWLIAHEAPERFRAAVAARGVYDMNIWYGSSNTWRLFENEFGTRPWEDPEIARAQSPLTYVANIRTPLLLLHADTDFRTTIASAEAMYRAMTVLQKDVEFVRYPREGHELTRSGEPGHRIDHMLRTLEYFERHVR